MSQRNDVHELARGRWRNLLPILGVNEKFLTGKHGPCPLCEGKDRFRWTDYNGGGGYICNQCGHGNGVDLVMAVNKVDFVTAKKLILDHVGSAEVSVKATKSREWSEKLIQALWSSAAPLTGLDPATKYLRRRGIKVNAKELKYGTAGFAHGDGTKTRHPVMVGRFVGPDRNSWTVQTTYLDDKGNKAEVPEARKLAPGHIPVGGAVRLAASADTMGIAEGIETALSAMQLFDVPVWAALTAGELTRWKPPENAKHILIFGDNDESYTGQAAAFALAHRLRREGKNVEVRLPDLPGDWNDVLQSESR